MSCTQSARNGCQLIILQTYICYYSLTFLAIYVRKSQIQINSVPEKLAFLKHQ